MAKMTRTWWGEVFLDVLAMSMDVGRLKRGRAYAGPNRLLKFSISKGVARATLRGNINHYFGVYEEPRYKVTVKLRQFTSTDWQTLSELISSNAACLSQLLMNEMPTAIDDALSDSGQSLLPRSPDDLISKCSCPDWSSPCKHVAGVYYKIASLLDRDPMLLFELRGLEYSMLRERLAGSPLGQAFIDRQSGEDGCLALPIKRYTEPGGTPAAGIDLKSYWKGEQPLPSVDAMSGSPPTPAVLAKKGGDHPAFWDLDRSFIGVMEDVCARVVQKNPLSL
ncbi:MAG: SWIM zinc finger family protein [Boseongicola sp.]|nr:SWIM zinc finger family protein [Boseongicola sp.]